MDLKTRSARFVYLAGCDGTGKTTHAAMLHEELRKSHPRTRRIWLRFPFLFSLPLLLLARLIGASRTETFGLTRIGYWDFSRVRRLGKALVWTCLLDAWLHSLFVVRIPLWLGHVLVCDRYVLDMVVDLLVGLGCASRPDKFPLLLFWKLVPRSSKVVVLDLDARSIHQRRPELVHDRTLERRLELYRQLADELSIGIISSASETAVVHAEIRKATGADHDIF